MGCNSAVALYASLVLERAQERVRTQEALALSDARAAVLQEELTRHEIVGWSPALLATYEMLRRFAAAGAPVLLRGETGTGKELFARAYAESGPRRGRAYVPVPIPALAPSLIESERTPRRRLPAMPCRLPFETWCFVTAPRTRAQ